MTWGNTSRIRTDNRSPRAAAVCDRCGFGWNHNALTFQVEFAGDRLVSTNMLVCPDCYDIPNPQVKTIRIPADPVPIANPRPQIPADGT